MSFTKKCHYVIIMLRPLPLKVSYSVVEINRNMNNASSSNYIMLLACARY